MALRIGAHAAIALRGQFGQFGPQPSGGVEQFLRPIAFHPVFEDFQVLGLVHVAHRHLVRAERAFGLQAVDDFRAGPALRRAEDDHRPAGTLGESVRAGVGLNPRISAMILSSVAAINWCIVVGIVAFDEIGRVAVALEKLFEFFVADARQHGRAGDFVAVQVQDRQHGAVVDGIEELVRVPTGGQRPGFRLAVADDAGDEQIGVVEARRRRRGRSNSRVRPLRGSSRAFRERRGWECRRETRTA